MAKAAASARLYGKAPKIEPEPGGGDTNRSGHEAGARKEAEKTAGGPEPQGDMTHGGNAKEDVMAGTAGIPTHHHTQAAERTEGHHRRMREHTEMHHRHESEHLMRVLGHHHEDHETMNERHHQEMKHLHSKHEKEVRDMHGRHEEQGEGPTGGIKEKPEGRGGTEPPRSKNG